MGDTQTIYLTFDDGIQPGTQEVFELLVKYEMRATFFMTGSHATHSEQNANPGLLKKIHEHPNFLIGNHSASHANSQYYSSYYSSGGVLLASQKRRTVLEDFKRCDKMLSDLLGLAKPKQFTYARLPGRNTWRIPGINITKQTSIWPWVSGDSLEEADALSQAGYQIFGWDLEWTMDFGGTNIHSDYDPEVDTPQTYDPNAPTYRNNFDLDRPTLESMTVMTRMKLCLNRENGYTTQKSNKVILLMHERAFRNYKPGEEKKHLSQLEALLRIIRREGLATDVISNY